MAYGFESKNDSGYIQIADSVSNLYMLYSGTILIPPKSPLSTTINYGTKVTVTHPTSFDAICLATDQFGLVVPQPVFDQSKTSATIVCEELASQTTVKYWLFKKYSSLAPSTSGYGMEIYDSTGAVAFSSNYPKLMRSYSTIPIANFNNQNHALPSNRKFAFLSYGTLYNTAVAPTKAAPYVKIFPVINTYSGGVNLQGSNVRGGRLTGPTPVYNGGLIAVDVTNY